MRAVRQRGSWKISAAFGVLAAAPLAPLLVDLARSPIPRFAVEGDYAGLEIATRYALAGKTLLGPYSRFGWNHPGPLYFYVIAPLYALEGRTSTGLYAGACVLNIVSAVAIAITLSLSARRLEAVAALLVLLAWLAAFGTVCVLPWNPLVVVLPLLAFLVLASQVARGHTLAAPFAVFFGMLASQTHLATAPTVIGVSAVVALMAFLVARRERGRHPRGVRDFTAAALLLLLLSTPMLLEQEAAHEGNLTKIFHFFTKNESAPKPFATAVAHWALATSWLPERLLDHAWTRIPFPQMMASDSVGDVASAFAIRSVVVWFAIALASAAVAVRRRYRFALSLLGTGLLASGIAIFAFRAVVDKTMYYLLFSATAASTLVWMGSVATCVRLVTEVARGHATERALRVGAVGVTLLAVTEATWLTHEWAATSGWHPRPFPGAEAAYESLLARVRGTGETPVIHAKGAWYIALMLLNELSRDGVAPRVEARDRWILGAQFSSPEGASRSLHVYPHAGREELEVSHCLARLVASEGIELFVSPVAARGCDR